VVISADSKLAKFLMINTTLGNLYFPLSFPILKLGCPHNVKIIAFPERVIM